MKMAENYEVIAPDLRGYGLTEAKPANATRGYADFAEDIAELLESLEIHHFHLMCHSLGGGVGWYLLQLMPERIKSLIQIAPASPYGFGGTKDLEGSPCHPDFTGSGGGIANPDFAKRIAEKDRSADKPESSPRVVIEQFYGKAPFQPANFESLLDGMLEMQIGEQFYPGDFESSEHFPFVRPGKWGAINAASPKYQQGLANQIIKTDTKPAILWVHGENDQIVSDRSLFDWGTLGSMGVVPDYPGEDVYPPQPMIQQTRSFLRKYVEHGGLFEEKCVSDCGHSPHLEYPDHFLQWVMNFISKEL